MNKVTKPKKLAGCISGSCPGVYQDNDSYLIVGEHIADREVPQTVSDDEAVITIDRSILEKAKS